MINISIIDDDRAMLNLMQKIVREAAGAGNGISIAGYERPDVFLEENEKRKCQILISDIDMPGMSGLEEAKRAREMNPRMFIVFVTAYMQYAIESYRMDAFQYVLKSELSDRLPRILGKLTEMIEKDKKSYGFVGTESNRKKVFYDDIIWLKKEKNAKYVTYILKNGRYTERASLESAVEKLDFMQFLNEGAQMAIEPEKAAKTRMDAERFLFHFLQNQGMQE